VTLEISDEAADKLREMVHHLLPVGDLSELNLVEGLIRGAYDDFLQQVYAPYGVPQTISAEDAN
jgi:hypothetical protein